MHMYKYAHMCMHVCVCVCVCVCVHTYTYTCTYSWVCIYMHFSTHPPKINIYVFTHRTHMIILCVHIARQSASLVGSPRVRNARTAVAKSGNRVQCTTWPAAPLRMSADEENESLQRLVDLPGRRYILVGGKGGVGKTSTSSGVSLENFRFSQSNL